jgi:creatinine amidohydrolase
MKLMQEMKWKEAEKEMKTAGVALIPVGATEQHGHHMPLGSDTYCSLEVAKRTAEREKAIVVPAIPYGISRCHMSFPGTITLSTDTLIRVVDDICESLFTHGIKKFILINGHGHNNPVLRTFMNEFKLKKGNDVYIFLTEWWSPGQKLTPELWSTDPEDLPDGHAADVECSAMLAIEPDLVAMSKAEKVVLGTLGTTEIKFNKSTSARLKDYPVDLLTISDFKQFTESGIIGSALGASKEKGEKVLDKAAEFFADLVREIKAI